MTEPDYDELQKQLTNLISVLEGVLETLKENGEEEE